MVGAKESAAHGDVKVSTEGDWRRMQTKSHFLKMDNKLKTVLNQIQVISSVLDLLCMTLFSIERHKMIHHSSTLS